jgi:hypothetical protein
VAKLGAATTGNQVRRRRLLIGIALIVIVATATAVVAVRWHRQQAVVGLRPSGIPASVPDGTVNLMGLSPVAARAALGSMANYTQSGTAYLPTGQLADWGRGIALVARTLAS